MRVSEAIEIVKRRGREREEFVYVVYVVDQDKLAGVVSLRELLIAEPEQGIAEVMRTNILSVLPTMDQEEVARRMAKYDMNVMPVVDDDGKLLGVITIDDIIDVLVAGADRGRPEDRRHRAARRPVFPDHLPHVHPQARRLARHPLHRGVLHPDGPAALRPDPRGGEGARSSTCRC